ncbi:serine/threonine protein kinase [Saccharophagus sp. K07]|jgi:serine/threonine protein kinase|uniref:serine/threonine-protein kinase n=1 Tax=Saccharophagus sp. K07 TaxID=2283636 RepID=UPI0016521A05|nr:serine/threonine-protein kinase [Saccharophagus sp. K07]MBC6905619.1 serine/threonine protein kinase [Saccharophagus sp. K07]
MKDGPGQPPHSPQDQQAPQDNKTRIQGRAVDARTRVQAPAKATPAAAQAEIQLTRIRQAIREQNSSQGFLRAKQIADRALAANKIILNNRFVLEATLGAGGMGTVYKAKDLRKVEASDPNPYVAVKVLNDDFKNHPNAFITLQREASRSHILSHPNIVTVHDFDRDGDVIYMTMELLQGIGLEPLIRQHKGKGLEKAKALRIVREIGIALAHAHQKHIIHSDLKPGNIFVCADGAKVLDFGIARLTSQTAASDFDAGSLGALTPAYASLEMFNGEDPHPADDVYALAIIAYELLAGEHPYQRKPAGIALKEKLRPAPIKSLTKQQWKTLERGLKLRRAERIQDITQFYKGLTQRRRSIKGLLAATVLISALGGTITYRYLVGDELDSRIAETYSRGQSCLTNGDFTCALDSAKAVLQLDASHQAARALQSAAEDQLQAQQQNELIGQFESCIHSADESCAKDALRRLKEVGMTARAAELEYRLIQFQSQQAQEQIMTQARECASQRDWVCIIQLSERAPELGNPEFLELVTQAQQARAQEQQALAERRREFQSLVNRAEACLAAKDYSCAARYAQNALSLGVDRIAAQSLVQRIDFAKEEYQRNLQRAENVLAKGQACFAKKNYSCAIASSESALEFVPDYAPALELRRASQKAVEELKSQIVIE